VPRLQLPQFIVLVLMHVHSSSAVPSQFASLPKSQVSALAGATAPVHVFHTDVPVVPATHF
jgi:hypothetical protein